MQVISGLLDFSGDRGSSVVLSLRYLMCLCEATCRLIIPGGIAAAALMRRELGLDRAPLTKSSS